ncbi:MAG: DinB family protein [Acidobacteria bacterium]|nr:DinB family protein [Acidobacteriota bacterium]
MNLADALLPEYDREMGLTRKLLERIPDDKFAWAPHAKSMPLGRLAEHLAELGYWMAMTVNQSEFDLATGRPEGYRSPATRDAVLAMFDSAVTTSRGVLNDRTDAELMAPWTLKRGGQELFTMPKAVVIRNFVLNHIVHHRGQLSVYLRLLDVPVPSIYGPSADEAI